MTRHHFQPTQYHNVIGTLPAVLEIASGDRVVTTTLDAAGTDHESAQRAPRGNPMTGPFFATGAELGAALLVTIERMTPNRKTGWTYSPLAPLFLMLFSGLYMFALPYAVKWRGGERAAAKS